MNIAESLKDNREQRGMNAYELAKALGVNHQNIYRWENGTVMPSIEMCIRIADFYGISLDELIGRSIWNWKQLKKIRRERTQVRFLFFIQVRVKEVQRKLYKRTEYKSEKI